MKLSVIIPCYNERETIQQIVERVKTAPVNESEIIVVDDASDERGSDARASVSV